MTSFTFSFFLRGKCYTNKTSNLKTCLISTSSLSFSVQFRKCLIQHFTGAGTIQDSNLNQTSERPGITAECLTGEMSAIAARIPLGVAAASRSDDSQTDCGSFAQLPIPENKVCPL